MLDKVEMQLRGPDGLLPVYFDVYDNSLSRKWLSALNKILKDNLHLEKNYCFFGFPESDRNLQRGNCQAAGLPVPRHSLDSCLEKWTIRQLDGSGRTPAGGRLCDRSARSRQPGRKPPGAHAEA